MSKPGESSFHPRKTEPCPSCLDREALDLLCRPRFPKTMGCEECGGKGVVLATGKEVPNGRSGEIFLPDHKREDPYRNKDRVRVS